MVTLTNRIRSLKKNGDFRNIFFGLLSYFITPVALFFSTPLLLHHLGSSAYGVWILINSIVIFMTFSNFGLGNAMVKLGSEYIQDSEDEKNQFNRLFNVTFTLSIIATFIIMILVAILGPFLLKIIIKEYTGSEIRIMCYLLGVIVSSKVMNSVIASTFMAKQRFDLNSKINICINLISVFVYTSIAVLTGSLMLLISALLISNIVLLLTSALIAKKIIPELKFTLYLNRELTRKVISFGVYTWFQALSITLLGQLDKIIIGSVLGPSALGYYSVCMTLAFKIHEIPVSAGGFLLAKFSSLESAQKYDETKMSYHRAFLIKTIFIICSTFIMVAFGKNILSIWINPEFAAQHYRLFQSLAIGVGSGAFIILPFYYMNAAGFVRLNSILSLATTSISIGLLYVLIPYNGLYSVAIGKLACIPFIMYALFFVQRKLRNKTQVDTELKTVENSMGVT